MRFLLAFLCPPLAILLCGKPIQAILCVLLWPFIFPAVLWALLVVSNHKADLRNRALMRNADKNSRAQVKAMERQTRELVREMRAMKESGAAQEPRVIQVHGHSVPQARPLPGGQGRLNPPAPSAQSPVPVQDAFEAPIVPKRPVVTVEDVRAFALQVREGAISGYRNLPVWAQPITWGLAAGTPVSIILAVVWLTRG